MKVAICHRGFAKGDAIGNDIAGMYRLLERLGLEPVIVCEWATHPEPFRRCDPGKADWSSFGLVIYHHSIYWAAGEELIAAARCPVLLRYHNITPPLFFQPYTLRYVEVCRRGRQQTRRLIEGTSHRWLAASNYNRAELLNEGADPERVVTVPPFNRIEVLLEHERTASYQDGPIEVLFVGRFGPGKGHHHLLKVAKAFMSEIGSKFLLRMVGATDGELERYRREIVALSAALGLQKHIQIREHCSDEDLLRLFQRSHVYLSCSEHEGFCVPIVEAQAIGLPLVASNMCAVADTAGQSQLLPRLPRNKIDYSFYAGLINELVTNNRLRDQVVSAGYANARARFTNEPIENTFVGAINDLMSGS